MSPHLDIIERSSASRRAARLNWAGILPPIADTGTSQKGNEVKTIDDKTLTSEFDRVAREALAELAEWWEILPQTHPFQVVGELVVEVER